MLWKWTGKVSRGLVPRPIKLCKHEALWSFNFTRNSYQAHLSPFTNHHNTHTIATMKRIAQSHLASLRLTSSSSQIYRSATLQCRAQNIHTTTPQPATVQPLTASGPPPKVPIPSAEHVDSRVARRRKQAELLKRGLDLKAIAGGTGGGSAKTKRFWREVHVKSVDGT